MTNIFIDLEDRANFFSFVTGQFKLVEQELGEYIACTINVDEKLLQFAHADYLTNIASLTLSIESRDPDHYKRCGALLHALNNHRPITGVHTMSDMDLTDMDTTSLPDQAVFEQNFKDFYVQNSNEFSSFALCYNLCCHHEQTIRKCSWDYIETVCVYLNNTKKAPVDSYFILFKSLMQFT